MKNKDLIQSLAVKLNTPETEIENWLQETISILNAEIVAGHTISFQGFGTFEVKRKEERLSVHPATKARTLIPPKLVVNFKQSTAFKLKLKDISYHE